MGTGYLLNDPSDLKEKKISLLMGQFSYLAKLSHVSTICLKSDY